MSHAHHHGHHGHDHHHRRGARMTSLRRTGLPTLLPITLVEAKEYLSITGSEFDDLINSLIPAGTRNAEDQTERTFITTTWTMKMDGFPHGREQIPVPRPPLVDVTSIQYIDADGALQTWDSSNFDADTNSEPGRIALVPEEFYPATEAGRIDSVIVVFVGGYDAVEADSVTNTPETSKLIVKGKTADLFHRRIPSQFQAVHNQPTIQGIIDSERVQVMV